jgi:predicted amidohydrolase
MATPAGTSPSNRLRVAVAQLAYHPAILIDRRSPLEDPLFDPAAPDSFAPEQGELPLPLKEKLDALRRRVRAAYGAQLFGRVSAVLARCAEWGARVVVFPEYSIPWELLPAVAAEAGDLVVVAGTHMVEQAARRSGLYEKLGAPFRPAVGQSVCPVLHGGRLLGLAPKVHAATAEQGSMRPGEAWAPIEMPGGLPGPLGALAALDFLSRESDRYRALIAEKIAQCRFLAVPALSPYSTPAELIGNTADEARRYGRPVLYSDGAEGGGTSIYAGEASLAELRRFPDRAGYLEPDDEGVIVADILFNDGAPGSSAAYSPQPKSILPFAAASLVYRVHPVGEEYARWLEETESLLKSDDDDTLDAAVVRINEARDLLLNAGALSGGEARGRRLRTLLSELDKVTRVEEIRQFTREIGLPKGLLPLADLRAAMASGAADVMFGLLAGREARSAGLMDVEERLRAVVNEHKAAGMWTNDGLSAFAAVAQAVLGAPEAAAAEVSPEAKVSVVAPSGVAPAVLGKREQEGVVLLFRERPSELRTLEGEPRNQDDLPALPMRSIEDAEPLYWLAVAEGAAASEGGDPVSAVGVWPRGAPDSAAALVLAKKGEAWEVLTARADIWSEETWSLVRGALRECGLGEVTVTRVDPEGVEFQARVLALLPRFERARAAVRALRDQRLRDLHGAFLEADARVDGGERLPVLTALDQWLASGEPTALLLGDYGTGKSVALAEWSVRRWDKGALPLPIFVSLAATQSGRDADALLLEASGLEDRPAHRAALRLLLNGPRPHLIPVFDGFDEMATRLTDKELAGSLSALLQATRGGGRAIVSARSSFFSLEAATEGALAQALGPSSELWRIEIELLTPAQIRELIGQFRAQEGDADEVFQRIRKIDDLSDLIRRPLLLGMVLATLSTLATGVRITRSDLYEAYLRRWLDQTRSGDPDCFTDEQKRELAESLADELWRSGRPASSWQEIKSSVRARLAQHLPEQMPLGAAFVELQLGALFMREGEDRYRFAHKTLLEYFLAKSLITVLPRRAFAALRTAPLTAEIASFLGEITQGSGEARESAPVVALQQFLRDGRKPHTRRGAPGREPDTAESAANAAANALRLLLGLKRWAGDEGAWIPEGADLRRVHLAGEDLTDAFLAFADLEGADLTGADLSRADLTGAYLEDTSFTRARLHRTGLARARARRADFTQAEAAEATLDGADLTDAVLRQSLWVRCSLKGVTLEGADLTGAAMPGCEPKSLAREAVKVTPPLAIATIPEIPSGRVTAAAWSRDGRSLVMSDENNTIGVWIYPTGAPLARIDAGAPVLTVSIRPDGSRVAGGCSDGSVRVFDAITGAMLAALKAHPGRIKAATFSPDGKRLATLSEADPSVRVFDTEDFHEIVRFGSERGIDKLTWSPDGRQIATTGPGDLVQLWDARAGAPLAAQRSLHGPLAALAWSPDGSFLAVVGARRIHLLDGKTGNEIKFLRLTHGVPYAIAWNADSSRIASAGIFGALHLWDIENRSEIRRFTDEGFTGLLVALHWGPDDDLVTRVSSHGEILRTNVTSPEKALMPAPNNPFETGTRLKIQRSPGGYLALPDGARAGDYVLALRRPEPGSRTELYLPLGALNAIVHRPDIVAAAREGDARDDDLGAELARLGLDNGTPWDGRPKIAPRARAGAEPPSSSIARGHGATLITAEQEANTIDVAPIQPNPFRPGSALTQTSALPGRAPVVAELLSLIESQSPAILIGPRRSGKTSLLHHVAARLSPSRPPSRIRHVTLEAKRIHSSDDLARVLDPTLHGDPSPAETLRRRLEEQGSAVLLLDEVANLCGADTSVFAWLRALGQEGTSVVFAGSPWDWVRTVEHAASAPGSSFGNDVTPVVLGPIPERDAVHFLTETAPPDVPIKEDRTAHWIVDICGPWPFYLQVMGYAVVQEVRAGKRKSLVERSAVLDLYDQRLLLERDAAFFHARWAELPDRAKQILRRIRGSSGGDLPVYRDLPPEDRKILRDTGLCDFGKWLQDKPFYDWIRRAGGDIDDEKKS